MDRVHTEFWTHFSRTFPGHFQDNWWVFLELFTIVENEMALKAPSNTATVWGRLESPHRGQGRALMEILGTKLLEALDNLLFHSTWIRAKNPHLYCVLQYKTQDKEPQSSKSNLNFINSITDYRRGSWKTSIITFFYSVNSAKNS